MNRTLLSCTVLVALMGSTALAWWDTVVTVVRPIPLLREYEAESAPGVQPAQLVTDPQANGGAGGQAYVLTPGGSPITIETTLKPGLYGLWGIVRTNDKPAAVGIATLTVRPAAEGQPRSWTMPFTCKDTYFSGVMMYFPVDTQGTYQIELSIEKDLAKLNMKQWAAPGDATRLIELLKKEPFAPVWLDRLELRDVQGNFGPMKQIKTKRMLKTDAELAELRQKFAQDPAATITLKSFKESFKLSAPPAWFTKGRTAPERAARNDEMWKYLPDYNAPVSHDQDGWGTVIGRDRLGLIGDLATAYEQTGNPELGWDAALLLAGLAEKYPAIDYFAQGVGGNLRLGDQAFGISAGPPGKSVYRGWAGPDSIRLITYYDILFDYIRDNKALAAEVSRRIPNIHSPEDLIRLIDTRLLRHIAEASNRNQIEGTDVPKALAPLVLGVGPDSDRMLREGIFKKISMNMTFRGGIDDQAICSCSRDGVHYIGSAGYLTDDLMEIAKVLHQYRKAGGDARFDLLDDQIYPHIREAQATLQQIRLAGGFRLIQGDFGDLRNKREPELTPEPFPSRILGGYGMSILESGQYQANPLLKRGLGIYFGIGRGHSQHDSLNIELMAQGTRVSPDLGGRHEGKNRGSPNMRSTRVHNLVEVDDQDHRNLSPSSVTSGTGWNTAAAFAPGIQFLEHHARATSHSQVTRYARQTAMIDVPAVGAQGDEALIASGNSYIFDVFRVAGGKTHTYSFHGAPCADLVINTTLTNQLDDDARNYLRDHVEGTRRTGIAPAMLQTDWPMTPALQKHYQGEHYQPDRPVTTRLSLFGVQGQKVLVGNASSEQYQYNFPFLYVRGTSDSPGRQSAYPAIIEPFAGEPFIHDKRTLPITPEPKGVDAPVALQVNTVAGTTDLLYASGQPKIFSTIASRTQSDGRFAFLSSDAAGLRTVQLVGGTTLKHELVTIALPMHAYEADIVSVQYPQRSFRIARSMPEHLLKGQWIGIANNTGLIHTFRVQSIKPGQPHTMVTHEKTARYYQSTVVNNDMSRGGIECEIEPPVFGADPQFIRGTTISNERLDRFARVEVRESDRWMHLAWPGYRTSYPNTIRMADVPDANGDGKRTLKLIGRSKEGRMEELLSLDVTLVMPDGTGFYFKLPELEKYQRGGWQFNDLRLVNEDASKTWRSIYPGSSYLWVPDPATPVASSDFTDHNGDGLTKLSAYLYGPGDRMVLDTFVHLRRVGESVYNIRANSPFTLSVPSKGIKRMGLSRDGKVFVFSQARESAGMLTLELTEADLGDGDIWLQLTK